VLTDVDLAKVLAVCQALPAAEGMYLEDDFITNLLATVVDYQMHTTAVQRALNHYIKVRRSELRALDDLKRLMAQFSNDKDGNTDLAQHLWGYNMWTRAAQLRSLTDFFESVGVVDQDSLRAWATQSEFRRDFEGRVKGLGPAVFNWLVMRQGVESVKPDVHVHRFTERAVGRRLSDDDVVQLVMGAARTLGHRSYELDWAIWEFERARR
jgi:hypothetical protein